MKNNIIEEKLRPHLPPEVRAIIIGINDQVRAQQQQIMKMASVLDLLIDKSNILHRALHNQGETMKRLVPQLELMKAHNVRAANMGMQLGAESVEDSDEQG